MSSVVISKVDEDLVWIDTIATTIATTTDTATTKVDEDLVWIDTNDEGTP